MYNHRLFIRTVRNKKEDNFTHKEFEKLKTEYLDLFKFSDEKLKKALDILISINN